MPFTEPDELPRRRSRGELLEHIYAEGERRRMRRRIGRVGLSVVAVVVLAGAVFAIDLPGGTPQHVATRGQTAPPSPGSTTSLLPTTSVPTSLATGGGGVATTLGGPATTRSAGSSAATSAPTTPATTVVPVTTTAPPNSVPATTVTTQVCRNSSDSACGPFHWEPDPGPNLPLVIDVTVTPRPADPRTFDFAIVYSDGDAPIVDGCRTVGFGDDSPGTFTGTTGACAIATCLVAYGAWTTPTPKPSRVVATVTHTFAAAGTYDVQLNAQAQHSLCYDPYSSWGTKTITVVVP